MKIIDKINGRDSSAPHFFSFEYFPPKTQDGLKNLYARFDRMMALEPLFMDITWGAGGQTSDQTLDIALNAQKYFGIDVMMHLTCTNMPQKKIDDALDRCKEGGVRNILALRGDPPRGDSKWIKTKEGFAYASDLTAHIRKAHGDFFGIAVGGYPEGHLEAESKSADIKNLKKKVDAGADFIITQLFYDIEEYKNFVTLCRQAGISCPIIPGLLPILSYERFQRFISFCGAKVPEKVWSDLEAIKHNDAKVKSYGIDLCTKMCEQLKDFGTQGFHFYTLNLESSVVEILRNLGLIDDTRSQRPLPWRPSTMPGRREETVRPIFWSNRPKSYTARTLSWDDFPNGRWGDARSPSFGDLKEYYIVRQGLGHRLQKQSVKELWGAPKSPQEVFEVFADFCRGKINALPWAEGEIKPETERIKGSLVELNLAGFLTINSQPAVNGAPSHDREVGWGDKGGYVYQKAYVEFFVHPRLLKPLMNHIRSFKSMSFQAVNVAGTHFSNVTSSSINAVTWGVFPGKEIVQPTVVDPLSFMSWKDEAFELWLTDWADRYEDDGHTKKVLRTIHDEYYLVNLVENNYVDGDIFMPFRPFLNHQSSHYAVHARPKATPAQRVN